MRFKMFWLRWVMVIAAVICPLCAMCVWKWRLSGEKINDVGIFVSIVSMIFAFIAVLVALKVNESVSIQALYRQYFTTDTLRNIRSVAMVERLWNEEKVPEVGRPYFQVRLPDGNYKGPIKILNIDKLCTDTIRRRPWTEKQDESRRAIANFYRLAYRLYESGNINKKALRDICTMDAFALLFDVVEPMEAIINDDYNWYEFYELMKIMKGDYQAICRKTQSHDVHSQYLDDKFKEWVPAEIGV